ncbi:MAG: 50S ribosomal protein L31 [Chloroflexi bacterium]|nr:50S ribosomal protein L31 [Chloroflexota bacterium]
MKPGIHPTWYPEAVVTCACGNTWVTGSTKKEIHTDVCSNCHPFFTGEQRIVDTAGQVERFMKRISAKEQIAASQPAPEEKKSKKDKRRERKTGFAAPLPPAELPLAATDIAPVAEMEQVRAEEDIVPAPAGEVAQGASIDKIVEPDEAPHGSETYEAGVAEVADRVRDVEMPGGPAAQSQSERKSAGNRPPRKPKPSGPEKPEES